MSAWVAPFRRPDSPGSFDIRPARPTPHPPKGWGAGRGAASVRQAPDLQLSLAEVDDCTGPVEQGDPQGDHLDAGGGPDDHAALQLDDARDLQDAGPREGHRRAVGGDRPEHGAARGPDDAVGGTPHRRLADDAVDDELTLPEIQSGDRSPLVAVGTVGGLLRPLLRGQAADDQLPAEVEGGE